MKTTADLPLTEYQRGQLAHIRDLMRLEATESASNPPPVIDENDKDPAEASSPLDNEIVNEKKRAKNGTPRFVEFSEARALLLSTITSFHEEEIKNGRRTSPPPILDVPEPKRQRTSLTKTPNILPPARKSKIGAFTPADTYPTERKIPPIPVAQPPVWDEKDEETTASLQVLAMTAYSEARSGVERKKAEFSELLKQFDQTNDPDELLAIQSRVDALKPELLQAVTRVKEAEARLKKKRSKDE